VEGYQTPRSKATARRAQWWRGRYAGRCLLRRRWWPFQVLEQRQPLANFYQLRRESILLDLCARRAEEIARGIGNRSQASGPVGGSGSVPTTYIATPRSPTKGPSK